MKRQPVDKRVKLYKAVAGLIPGGSFVVEYMIARIPDQRINRLFAFIEELSRRIEELERRQHLHSDEFAYLAENAIIQSVNTHSAERRSWLASLAVPRSPNVEASEWDYRLKALYILSTLVDDDVQCLMQYSRWETKVRYDQIHRRQHFVSVKDRRELPDHDLFLKYLANATLDVRRSALASHGLLVWREEESEYQITKPGELFIYAITGKYPR